MTNGDDERSKGTGTGTGKLVLRSFATGLDGIPAFGISGQGHNPLLFSLA